MARTIKNDDFIKINRTFIMEDGTSVEKEVTVGRYYFEATRECKQCTIQLFFDEPITSESEKEIIGNTYNKELNDFVNDINKYGWENIIK